MQHSAVFSFINKILPNIPSDWLNLTTHRLDIYKEDEAKNEFLEGFERLFQQEQTSQQALSELPTAYDYIRLGHPLSCVLEWMLGKINNRKPGSVIAFSSETMSVLSVLRKNSLEDVKTRLVFDNEVPSHFDFKKIKEVYEYDFEVQRSSAEPLTPFKGTTVLVTQKSLLDEVDTKHTEFIIHLCGALGSMLRITDAAQDHYIADIQHVRRRETVAMTPEDTFKVLKSLVEDIQLDTVREKVPAKAKVQEYLHEISGIDTTAYVGTSGLSIQYAIMMGLIDHAKEQHAGKPIKFIVPTNCYGGTNDQARRVAACIEEVTIVDLHVDGDNDMVSGLQRILDRLASEDAVPYIIAEIPTNPRVEVPHLQALENVLIKQRHTAQGTAAITPVFILDQTFCPNLQFMKEGEVLSQVKAITYASGSKFPSGGKCTAGYCYANQAAEGLGSKISQHLSICDNEATALQYRLLEEQLPSMNNRIAEAYKNTRKFVNYISDRLPEAKINFVSEELALRGFTPSVFSLDLPTKGDTPEEREAFKRKQNLKLIHMMIEQIPQDSKFCVSYGQLKGCYWTVPATSTQGTTKEEDKDYIVRASLSPDLDLDKHKEVFGTFVNELRQELE